MIEVIVGFILLLLILKTLFWLVVVLFSPILLVGGILLAVGLFVLTMVGGILALVFKLLFLPLLFIMLLPLCWVS